jgi:hypothetical protein
MRHGLSLRCPCRHRARQFLGTFPQLASKRQVAGCVSVVTVIVGRCFALDHGPTWNGGSGGLALLPDDARWFSILARFLEFGVIRPVLDGIVTAAAIYIQMNRAHFGLCAL